MKKISTDLYNKRLDIYASIELPATAEEIGDALEQVRDYKGNNKIAILNHFTDNLSFLCQNEIKACNVYELNHFAEMLVEMDLIEFMRFEGLVKSEFSAKKEPKISDLINLIMNLEQCNVMNVAVSNDYDLGKFYVDNDFIAEVNGDTPTWLLDNLDYKKVGKQMRESENGQFVKGGYVVNSAEIKHLYNGKYPNPTSADYVFKLLISKAPTTDDQPNEENLVELKLPTTDEICRNAINQTGATSIADCVFYEFKSTIPQLDEIFGNMEDIETLNQLAINLQYFKKTNELLTYKAMLSTFDKSEITLETALEICEYTSEFDMEYTLDNPSAYAKFKTKDVEIPQKDKFNNIAHLQNYGAELMQNDGVELTLYGALIPKDGITLTEKMEQAETQNQVMAMGGLGE